MQLKHLLLSIIVIIPTTVANDLDIASDPLMHAAIELYTQCDLHRGYLQIRIKQLEDELERIKDEIRNRTHSMATPELHVPSRM